MPANRETIERVIQAARSDVDEVLSGHNVRVKAIQFLLPDTHQLNEIQRFLYCEKGTQQSYLKPSNVFVYGREEVGSDDKVLQSLYYLDFVEPFRYECYQDHTPQTYAPLDWEISPEQFDIRKNPPVPISPAERQRLGDRGNLDPFWQGWCETLLEAGYGFATLWTYVRLRKADGDGAISSGILVFDGCLSPPRSVVDESFRKLSAVSKRVQEALYELTLNLFKLEITRQATRAAISQIMARNMSHNVGSHVSYKATNIAIKNRIVDLYPHAFFGKEVSPREELNRQGSVIDWIDFMSEKLDKYEIHRNEYLADFNLSPQSFRFYQDVLLPFCENTLILDNLASAEGAHYVTTIDNKLKIRVFIKSEGEQCFAEIKARYPTLTCDFPEVDCAEEVVYPEHFPYLLRSRDKHVSLADGFNSKRLVGPQDADVLLHSEQGLYSILENFIRNSAKHNKDALASSPLEVRIYLEDKGDRYNLVICDNVSELRGSRLFDSAPGSSGLYQRIKQSIVGNVEQAGRQNLGFADMNINSFLFKHKAVDVGDESLSSNFQLVTIGGDPCDLNYSVVESAYGGPDASRAFHFGYLMELLKPRKVLWIGEDVRVGGGGRVSDMKAGGVFRYDDLTSYLNDAKDGKEEVAAFEFVVFYKSFDYDNYLTHQIKLPPRVLVVAGRARHECAKPNVVPMYTTPDAISSADDLVESCWEHWLGRLPKRVAAYVYYENNREAAADLDRVGELRGGHTIASVNNLAHNVVITNDVTSVLYDHHGRTFAGNDLRHHLIPDRPGGKHSINFYTGHSKIVFDKGSDDFVRLNQLPADDHKKRILAYQLIDAATTNVFVLDERIAILANDGCHNDHDKQEGVRFRRYDELAFSRYCYGKVFALNFIGAGGGAGKPIHSGTCRYTLTLHIDASSLSVSAEDAALKVLGDVDALSKDVLVIHRTYMKPEILGMGVKDFLDLAGRTFGSVIVTSGGGYPHSIKEQVRFIPFSIIQQCLGSRLSKLKLVSFLQKLRYVG